MSKLLASAIHIIEGDLYRAIGEDQELFLYDCVVQAVVDGDIYQHKHVFKGGAYCDGFTYPVDAKGKAEYFVSRIYDAGCFIDTAHWECIGNLSEQEDAMDRLKREWSDTSDHHDIDDGSICYENFNAGV